MKKKVVKKEIFKPVIEDTTNEKRMVSIAIITLMASLAAFFGITQLVLLFYNPDMELVRETAAKIILFNSNPEPLEALLFKLGVLTIPLFLTGFIWSLTKTRLNKIKWEKCFELFACLLVLIGFSMIYFGLTANNPNYVEVVEGSNFANSRDINHVSNFDFYFSESWLEKNLIIYLCLIVPLILGLLLFVKYFPKIFKNRIIRNIGLVITIGYAAFYCVLTYQIFTFDFPYTWENKYDFNTVYYPMTQVYAGNIMLTDYFICNYGLYPMFLNPIFKIIGLDISSFTSVMALLNVASLSLILVAMLRIIKSKLLVLLSFSSILFISIFLSRLVTPFNAVFAMLPIRQLIPAIALCMGSFYFFNKNRILYFASFIILACSILWNPEFGIVAFLSWALTLSYLEFSSNSIKTIIINIAKHILVALLSIVLCFGFFYINIYLKSGSFPNMMMLFNSMIYFGSLGAGMLPMTLIHPWNFVILIYLTGLTYSIYALFNKSMLTPKTAFILFVSVIGIGLFTYFQGRSHNWNLVWVISPAMILLAISADMLLEKIKKIKHSIPHILTLFLILSVLGFSGIDLFLNQEKLVKLMDQKEERLTNKDEEKQIKANINFIKEQLPETTEKIYIHTSNKYQALYFGACHKKSAFNPSIVDLFTYDDCTRLKNKMLVDTSDVFIEVPNFYYNFLQNTNAAMCATRSVKASNDRMVYLKKRTYSTIQESVLQENSNHVLLYEKFTDDTISLNKRVDYAIQGGKNITWNKKFSFETVFHAEEQAYIGAVVFSNYADSCGIELIRGQEEDQYVVRWSENLGIAMILENNRWHYVVMQTEGDLMTLFLNGQLLYHIRFDQPIRNTDRKFFIGSSGRLGQQYFTGAISEVLLKNGFSSLDEIKRKQKKLEELYGTY